MATGHKLRERAGLIGDVESVLKPEFVEATREGKQHKFLPFKGKLNLPTREQVIKLFMYMRKLPWNYKMSKEWVAGIVAEHICTYWRMANFDTIFLQNIERKIVKDVVEYENVSKYKRQTERVLTVKNKYKMDVKKIFDIASKELVDRLKKNRLLVDRNQPLDKQKLRLEEDLAFLEDQYGPRLGSMGDKDSLYAKKAENIFGRQLQKSDQQEKHSKASMEEEKAKKDVKEKQKRFSEEVEDSCTDDDYKLLYNVKRPKTVTLELPKNPWSSPEVTSMLDRTKLTSRQALGIFSALVKTGTVRGEEVDLNSFTLSQSSIHRSRDKNRGVLLQMAREEFELKKPKHMSLHWDGKMMKTVVGEQVEWESILVAGAPHYLEGKLLTVTRLYNEKGKPTSTGQAQAEAVLEQIEQWKVADFIRSFVFDTTASNSGVRKGCCVRVMKSLGKVVFFCACRHHICELVAKNCWYSMFKEDLSPDCKFFKDVKEALADIDTSNDADITELSGNLYNKQKAIDFYIWLLGRKNKRNELSVRDDYRELAMGSLRLLGVKLDNKEMIWKKCGASHKAR